MKIENLKDLEAVLKLCRKYGIEHAIVDNVKLKLGEAPEPKTALSSETPNPGAQFSDLSDDELLTYSAR